MREITDKIKACLSAAGLAPKDGIWKALYDDSAALVSLNPEVSWLNGLTGACFICIFADYVQQRQRFTPFYHTQGGAASMPVGYDTPEEMVAAVRKFMRPSVATCWLEETPATTPPTNGDG